MAGRRQWSFPRLCGIGQHAAAPSDPGFTSL